MEIPEECKGYLKYFSDKTHYILDDNKNVIPATLMEWGSYLQQNRKDRIVKKEIVNGCKISTVFIGLDHSFSFSPIPEIFETMIFVDEDMKDIYLDRYATWKEAEEGHERAVQWVKDGCKDEDV